MCVIFERSINRTSWIRTNVREIRNDTSYSPTPHHDTVSFSHLTYPNIVLFQLLYNTYDSYVSLMMLMMMESFLFCASSACCVCFGFLDFTVDVETVTGCVAIFHDVCVFVCVCSYYSQLSRYVRKIHQTLNLPSLSPYIFLLPLLLHTHTSHTRTQKS